MNNDFIMFLIKILFSKELFEIAHSLVKQYPQEAVNSNLM